LRCRLRALSPQVLGRGSSNERAGNLATVLDGYFVKGGHHVNINVLNRDMLEDAVQVCGEVLRNIVFVVMQ
jgi:formate C-acetyltransferase